MPSLLTWNSDERPRERLFSAGPDCLSDAELLALLLGSGTRGRSAVETARQVLARVGELRDLGEASLDELRACPGIGEARAAMIQAALELGRRAVGAGPRRGARLGSASDVWAHYRARLAHRPVEEFWVLALDARHRLLFESCAARGCLTGVEVHPRDVFRPLIRASAAAAIFCHNHPSGDPVPSRQDIDLTSRLREVGDLCGIAVLDHVVVASEGFTSLRERGW